MMDGGVQLRGSFLGCPDPLLQWGAAQGAHPSRLMAPPERSEGMPLGPGVGWAAKGGTWKAERAGALERERGSI